MIDEETVDLLVERLIRRIELMNTYFLMEMGSSIKKIKKLTPSEAQKLVQILKYGGNYEEMIQELSKYTGLNTKDLDKIFKAYAKKDQMFYKDFYEYRNKPFIPFDENVVLQRQTEALKNIASQEMYNFTRSNVLGYTISDLDGTQRFFGLRETYNRVLDDALLSVSQGKETFNSSMSRIMKEIGGSGLKTLNYESGRSIRLDSAIRMQLKSQLRELHNENQKIIGEEIGADGVEITVHENPAPDHTEAQGKQFSNEEYEKLQTIGVAKTYDGKQINMHLDLKRTMATRLSFRPISKMNCYHRVYSIILGVSKPTYSNKELNDIKKRNIKGFDFNGKHYTMYEGTQLQRNLERKIREQKDIQIFAKASGDMELVDEAQHKITQLTNKYKALSEASGLPLKKDRLLVSEYKRTRVDLKKYYEDNLIGLANGTYEIKGVSNHIIDKKWERNMHIKDLKDAFSNPLHYGNITYNKENKPSIKIIGKKVTVYINPNTEILTTWHPTHSKTRKKYERK